MLIRIFLLVTHEAVDDYLAALSSAIRSCCAKAVRLFLGSGAVLDAAVHIIKHRCDTERR